MAPKHFLMQCRIQLAPVLMLLLLHLALSLDIDSAISRSLLLAHLGLFLLWQPVWHTDQKLGLSGIILFFALTATFIYWINWWLITGWVILLIGLAGGKASQNDNQRVRNVLILAFLAIILLVICARNLFNVSIPVDIDRLFTLFAYSILLALLFIPGTGSHVSTAQRIDLFSTILAALLAGLVMLGTVVNTYPIMDKSYGQALAEVLVIIGVFLLLISWLLSPRGNYGSLAQLWTESLLNIGTPFEKWLEQIATQAREKRSPNEFVEAAVGKMVEIPVIKGVRWSVADHAGSAGKTIGNSTRLQTGDLTIDIITTRQVSTALLLHFKLLIQIMGYFYSYKLQERELSSRDKLQLIHETGARVTHDIKNLLQALRNITAAISNPDLDEDALSTFQNQLPLLMQRLELALGKLQMPDPGAYQVGSLDSWWQQLKGRVRQPNITFSESIDSDKTMPADLFDSVIDNMLENIQHKMQLEKDIQVRIELVSDAEQVRLRICDNGSRIPEHIAAALFTEPLESRSGLGIGLYQASKQAIVLGYTLRLIRNRDGLVCFELTEQAPVTAT